MSSDEEKSLAKRKKKRKQKQLERERQAAEDAEFEEQTALFDQMKKNTDIINSLLGKTP